MKKRSFILVVLMLICSVFCLVGCTGPQGEQGIQGPKGETGAAGKDGIDGETGEQGPKGDRGSKGETGPQGEKGDKGDQGEKGDSGKNVEFSVDSTGIKWRYEGDAEWQNLLTFDDLDGYSKKYSVQFDLAGGTSADVKDLTDVLYKQELTLVAPTKEGCTFKGWSDGKEVYTETYQVKGDVKLTAVWGYEVTLDLNGGEIVGTYKNVEELKAAFLADYSEWKNATVTDVSVWDANAWKFFNEAAYSAKWKPLLQYLYDVEVSQASAEKPADAPSTSGHDLYTYLVDALAGKDLHALYPGNGEYCVAFSVHAFLNSQCYLSTWHYTADFSSSEVQNEVLEYFIPSKATKYVVTCGEQLVLPKVAKGNLVIRTWNEGENNVGLIITPTKACTLTAQFGVEVQLVAGDDTTDPVKETIATPVVVGENDAEYTLPTLTRDHYTFLGWFDGDTKVETVKNTDSYKKLTAKWQGDEHKVEFDMNYAEATTSLENLTTVYGNKVGELPEATRENKVFDGWYLEADCKTKVTSSTVVRGDMKVYAKWIEPSVSVTFETNGAKRAVENAADVKTVFLTDFYNWCVAKGAFKADDLSLTDFIGTKFNGKWFCYVGGAGNPSSLYTNYNSETQVNYMVDYATFKGKTPTASEDTSNVYFLGDKDMYAKWSPFMSYICKLFGSARAWTEITPYYTYELGRYMQEFNKENSYVTIAQLQAVPTGMESLTINASVTKDVVLGTKVDFTVTKDNCIILGWTNENGELVEEVTRELDGKTLYAAYVANDTEKFVIHKNTQAAAGDYAVYEGMNILKNGYAFKTSTYNPRVALTYSNGIFTVVEIVNPGTKNSDVTAAWDYMICGYDGTYKAATELTALNFKVGDRIILSKNIVGLAEGCYNIDAYILRAE